MPCSALSLSLSALLVLASCSGPEPTGAAGHEVVYGDDDRQDVYAFEDQPWAAQAAGFAAVMIPVADVDESDPDDVALPPTTLADLGVCPDERFADQLVAGLCSGTLIAPDLLLTAGHCIDDESCPDNLFVFDYYMTSASSLQTITSDDVYRCSDVLVSQNGDIDYAVVRLDRAVAGRTPALVNAEPVALAGSHPLIINGFPTGLPLKIDDGGRVRNARAGTLDFFVANLDSFGGNSGSGVFDALGRELVGILVRGDEDYIPDEEAECDRVNVCPNNGCRGESSTYAFRAIEALCESGEAAPGICPCGDGACDAEGGESTATCPFDCGTECGDGACNGDESPRNCTQDCGTCGNGTCDGDDSQESCCADCGCPDGDVCLAEGCVLDPGPGDTCEQPFTIEADGEQTVEGDTTNAQDDLIGSCLPEGGRDRVYTFELAAETGVTATVTGFDTGMYLRSTCESPTAELACNDDIDTKADILNSSLSAVLPAGTYSLIVDGFDDTTFGPYTLTVGFDRCPADPGKTEPGLCGCGAADVDADEDETVDCQDPCPLDATDQCMVGGDGADDGDDDEGGCSAGRSSGRAGATFALSLLLVGLVRRRRRR